MPHKRPHLLCKKILFRDFAQHLMSIDAEAPDAAADDESNEGDDRALAIAVLGAVNADEPGASVLLSIENPRELSAFLAMGLATAALSNNKAALAALKETYSGDALLVAYEAHEATLPFQKLQRNPDNSIKIDKNSGLPLAVKSPRKLSEIFASGGNDLAFARALPWSEPKMLASLRQVCANRASHFVGLSGSTGRGGFLRTDMTPASENLRSVSEDDFLTRNTQSFGGDAGIQSRWMLALSLIEYDGQALRLPDLFAARPDLAAQVCALLADAGIDDADELLDTLATRPRAPMVNEAQVFAGTGPETKVLSVLAPFSLAQEIRRAKFALNKLHQDEQLVIADRIKDEIIELQATLDATLPLPKRAGAKVKAAHTAALAAGKEQIAEKKSVESKARKAFLTVPNFVLPFGGANPRNMAYGLNSGLHTSNVLNRIFATRPTHKLGRKTFFPHSLIRTVAINGPRLPDFFKPKRYTAAAKGLRASRFSEVCYAVISPLLEMQDLFGQFHTTGANFINTPAVEELVASQDAWAVFVKGDDSLNTTALTEKLLPLAEDIEKVVKTSFVDAYGADFPDDYDPEMAAVIKTIMKLERA